MFKDYEYIKPLSYYEEIKQRNYCQIKIIDTDFEEIVPVVWQGVDLGWGIATLVIDCYTKRGLPVAPNFFRYMLQERDTYGSSLDDQVEWYKKFNPRWHEVENDIQMYLMFS